MIEQVLAATVGIIGGGVVVWIMLRRPQGKSPATDMQELQRTVTDRLDRVTEQIDRRLQESTRAMNESKSFLASRVSSTERSVRDVSVYLSKLAEATSALQHNTAEIMSFQQLLKSPKVRGGFGEILLGSLLADVLPNDRYELQYTFPGSGEIADAIIRLQDGYIVAIDSKFPLANFERYAHEDNPEAKKALRIQLNRDIKKHVTDISNKYISPSDKTFDFAFMYIPMEGVYYEVIMRDDNNGGLWDYCSQRKIVPVSPNSFVAYLHTVLIGLRGLKIEQQAKEIMEHLRHVRKEFSKFSDDFAMVGKHLNNAKNRYDESSRRLDKFSNRLEQIEGGASLEALPEETASEPVPPN